MHRSVYQTTMHNNPLPPSSNLFRRIRSRNYGWPVSESAFSRTSSRSVPTGDNWAHGFSRIGNKRVRFVRWDRPCRMAKGEPRRPSLRAARLSPLRHEPLSLSFGVAPTDTGRTRAVSTTAEGDEGQGEGGNATVKTVEEPSREYASRASAARRVRPPASLALRFHSLVAEPDETIHPFFLSFFLPFLSFFPPPLDSRSPRRDIACLSTATEFTILLLSYYYYSRTTNYYLIYSLSLPPPFYDYWRLKVWRYDGEEGCGKTRQ